MKYSFVKGIAALGLVALLVSPAALTQAQVVAQPISACRGVVSTLSYGSQDFYTQGQVSVLQDFLAAQGYFHTQTIGVFGPMTFSAVRSFQAAHGIPTTGTVGPLTRAAMAQIGCGTNVPPPTTSSPVVYSITPGQGPTGATVSITGYGFSANNTVMFDGSVAASNVSAVTIPIACTLSFPQTCATTSQTLTFTVPQYLSPYCAPGMACPQYVRLVTPGSYQVSVQNSGGTSNSQPFIVTNGSSTQNQSLSISGLDAPAQLALGQQGTWVVHANTTSPNLHYSVTWGDEYQRASSASIMYPGPITTQNSATFTHSYSQSGTYTATFTVSDDFGHSVSTSASVTVTPLY